MDDVKAPPRPPRSYNVGGYRYTGEYRLRVGWFGRVSLEELVEWEDGRQEWKKPFFGYVYFAGSYRKQ